MKPSIVIIFILLLFISCKENIKESIVYKEDTTKLALIKDLYKIRIELDSINPQDSLLQSSLERNRTLVDSLLWKTLDFKESALDLNILTNTYDKLVIDQKELTIKVDSSNKKLEELKLLNESLEDSIIVNKVTIKKLNKKAQELSKATLEASKIQVSGIEIRSLGHKSLINKTLVDVEYANKIKRIKLKCSIPSNILVKERRHVTMSMRVYGSVKSGSCKADTSFFYEGKEVLINLSVKDIDFAPGKHKVEIVLNNEVYKTSYIIMK